MTALDTAKALDLIGRDKPPVATCPRDGEPLISTMAFAGAEFCCIVCGGLLGFLDPAKKEETPELMARHDELRALWDEHAQPLVQAGDRDAAFAWVRSCPGARR